MIPFATSLPFAISLCRYLDVTFHQPGSGSKPRRVWDRNRSATWAFLRQFEKAVWGWELNHVESLKDGRVLIHADILSWFLSTERPYPGDRDDNKLTRHGGHSFGIPLMDLQLWLVSNMIIYDHICTLSKSVWHDLAQFAYGCAWKSGIQCKIAIWIGNMMINHDKSVNKVGYPWLTFFQTNTLYLT